MDVISLILGVFLGLVVIYGLIIVMLAIMFVLLRPFLPAGVGIRQRKHEPLPPWLADR